MYVGLSSPTSSAVPQTAPNASTCLICTISLFDEATPPHPLSKWWELHCNIVGSIIPHFTFQYFLFCGCFPNNLLVIHSPAQLHWKRPQIVVHKGLVPYYYSKTREQGKDNESFSFFSLKGRHKKYISYLALCLSFTWNLFQNFCFTCKDHPES